MDIAVKNRWEERFIPEACRERFLRFGPQQLRLWPGEEVHMAGLSDLVPGYRIVRTGFPHHVALYLTAGEMIADTGGGNRVWKAGDILFLEAGSRYHYHAEVPCSIVWFHLIADAPCWKKLPGTGCFARPALWAGKIPPLLELLYSETSVPGPTDSVVEQLLCRLILTYLRKELFSEEKSPARRLRIHRLFEEVEADPAHAWTVRELARKAGMSVANFFPAVNRIYGKSPGALLQEIRLNAAARLLQYSDCKLDTIAHKTGFSCGFALSRAFRRHYGASPAQWRSGTHP